MINKSNIIDITYIDDISVLKEKYNINAYQIGSILYNIDGTEYGELPHDIEEKRAELIAEHNALNYQRKRKQEYPPITEYIDAIVKGDEGQLSDYISKCLAVKAKYPKPTE